MSSAPYVPASGNRGGGIDYSAYEDDAGYGLVTFAGVMISIAAVLNVVYGIGAVRDANALEAHGRYIFGNLHLWGWFLIALGVVQGFAALAIWRGVHWGRWFGVASARVELQGTKYSWMHRRRQNRRNSEPRNFGALEPSASARRLCS